MYPPNFCRFLCDKLVYSLLLTNNILLLLSYDMKGVILIATQFGYGIQVNNRSLIEKEK